MLALRAVEPDRCRSVLDCDCEGGVRGLGVIGSRNKAGPETAIHGLAWACKLGLNDGVGLRPEVESDGITLGGRDVVGCESERGAVANANGVIGREGGASQSGSSRDS